MSQKNDTDRSQRGAESQFREAFLRLKSGTPRVLANGATVSQNNVAREAGCDPSALRKSRYPALILEIQDWVTSTRPNAPKSRNQIVQKSRQQNRSLRKKILEMKEQRDHAMSLLLAAHERILELTEENDMLRGIPRESNILPLETKQPQRGL